MFFNKPFAFLIHAQIHRRKQIEREKMHSNWFNALKTLSVIFLIFLINTKYLALAEEIPNIGSDDAFENFQIQEPEEARMAKRAWSQLQGSWGKRSYDGINEEQRQKVLNNQNDEYLDKLRTYDYEPVIGFNFIPDSDDIENSPPVEKRAWTSMNGAWGKRNWNKLRSTGKREPGNWNNLRGLWGKRSNDLRSWDKLSSAWGK